MTSFQKVGLFFTLLFCGIDVAKCVHVASIFNPSTGELELDSLHFDNNAKGFNSLLSNLSKLSKDNEVIISFESTAHYHQTLFNFLTSQKYKCYFINPYMTSKFRSISLRDAKNDNIDSRAIAHFLSFEHKNLINEEFQMNELKELATQKNFLKECSTKTKIKLKAYLDRTFPELTRLVNIHTKSIRAILIEYPTAAAISKVRIDKLKRLARDASKGKLKLSQIDKIKETAKSSIGIDSPSLGISIVQAIEMLELYEKQIDIIESRICANNTVINSPLHHLKGIGNIEIGYIMSAIISIDRFDRPKKLVAYAGLDPKVRQSGTWQASKTRMSKRGNKLLRMGLIWVAFNVSKHSGSLNDYYNRKKAEGKSHYNALGHCATKICRYIFWILKHPDEQFSFHQ